MGLLRRGIEPTIGRLLDSAKVVVIEGGRSVGKTTLARRIATERAFETVFDLSDPADLAALEADAFRVLDASPGPVLIDEAQLIPDLTVAVKRLVDQSGRFGQVLLTGSSRIGRGALGGGDPLAGRAVRARLIRPSSHGRRSICST
jgi:predicted AAA+ superfamily ATPase